MNGLPSEVLATLRICCRVDGRKFVQSDLKEDACITCHADSQTAKWLRVQLFACHFEPLPDETYPLSGCRSPSCLNPRHMVRSADTEHQPWTVIQWDDSETRNVYWLTPTDPDPLRVET